MTVDASWSCLGLAISVGSAIRQIVVSRVRLNTAAAGRRPAKLTVKQVCTARKMLADPEMTIKEVAEVFGVNRATIYRSLGLGAYAKAAEAAARPRGWSACRGGAAGSYRLRGL